MKLTLDHTQRLNLHALMGAQRGSVDDVRLWWRLQDLIELSEPEKKTINFRIARVGEIEQPMWDANINVAPKIYDLGTEDFKRIEKIIKEWQHGFLAASDRRWLEPLLKQFDEPKAGVNGSAPEEVAVLPRNRA